MTKVELKDQITAEVIEQESEGKPEPIGAKQSNDNQAEAKTKPKAKPKPKPKPAPKRKKTTVELLPDTGMKIAEIQFLHRQSQGKKLPMWKLLDEAVTDLLKKKRK